MKLPEVSFDHLLRLSDDTGLFEHARGSLPRREHGYCLDDVARGLVVLSRAVDPGSDLSALADRYLAFVSHAQYQDGSCHNRLGYERLWLDTSGTGDWWGRALWGLGSVVAGTGPSRQREDALDRFELSAQACSDWPRAIAFSALGAAEVHSVMPENEAAERLLTAALGLGRPGVASQWPWPEDRLTYANAAWAEALIAAGAALGDPKAVEDGLTLLSWLVTVQTVGDHLSVVPSSGWDRGHIHPGFDQQPIEVAALADACSRAFTVTGDTTWRTAVHRCTLWFMGDNDSAVVMYDAATGGGFDGLERNGVNRNQGAESTLAWLMTLQQAQRLSLDARSLQLCN